MSTTAVLIESQYLPPLEFFTATQDCETIYIEKQEHFVKQTFRNRCIIRDANRTLPLIVPIVHGEKRMSHLQINYQNNKWQWEHWRALESAYNKSPFMLYYAEELKDVLFSRKEKLFDFNQDLLTFCLKKLNRTVTIRTTEQFEKVVPDSSILDLRGKIIPKKSFSERKFYRPVEYFQQFGKTFEPNLSIIDLLMNVGPESASILRSSQYSD